MQYFCIFFLIFFSARKRLIQKLNDEGVPPNQIIQISGHKNVNSLNNDSKLNNDQTQRISDILSNKPLNTPPTDVTQASTTESSASMPPGFFAYSNFHGNVTFNFSKETQNLAQLTQQMIPPAPGPLYQLPAPGSSPTDTAPESPLRSPAIPPNRKFKRIRLIPESDMTRNCYFRQNVIFNPLFNLVYLVFVNRIIEQLSNMAATFAEASKVSMRIMRHTMTAAIKRKTV